MGKGYAGLRKDERAIVPFDLYQEGKRRIEELGVG